MFLFNFTKILHDSLLGVTFKIFHLNLKKTKIKNATDRDFPSSVINIQSIRIGRMF
jgi:hypothetical protein